MRSTPKDAMAQLNHYIDSRLGGDSAKDKSHTNGYVKFMRTRSVRSAACKDSTAVSKHP